MPGKAPTVHLMSFSYRKGVPKNSVEGRPVKVFDARKVRNPWRFPDLRKLNGKDPKVREFVRRCRSAQMLIGLAKIYAPTWQICIGCMGGRHRSVALVEELRGCFKDSYTVKVVHRDLK